jgi:hypothetical protein
MGTEVGRRGHVGIAVVAFALSSEVGTAYATPTSHGGVAYDQECFDDGVPMPPDFFPRNGASLWTYNGMLTDSQSFTGAQRYIYFFESMGDTFTPDSPFNGVNSLNPQGICAANVGTLNSPVVGLVVAEINILCQGANGKTCFWRWPGFPALSFPLPSGNTPLPPGGTPGGPLGPFPMLGGVGPVNPRISSRDSNEFQQANSEFGPGDTGTAPCNPDGTHCIRAFAGGDERGFNDGRVQPDDNLRPLACSACHAGENMIINHPGTATDFRVHIVNAESYFPTLSPGGDANWPDPIVPVYTPGATACSNGIGPCNFFPPFNPGPSNYPSYVNGVCFNCHILPTTSNFMTDFAGGRFPMISAALGPGDLFYATAQQPATPDYANTVFFPAVNRPMISPCTSSNCDGAMPLTEPNGHSALGDGETFAAQVMNGDSQWLTDVQAPTFGGSQMGDGYQWPQIGVTAGQYLSPYGNSLDFTNEPDFLSSFTALEATSTHFCWVTGFVLPKLGVPVTPVPSMRLTRFTDPKDNREHWQLVGANRTPITPFGRINAQCAPWGAIFASPVDADTDDAIIPSYNFRQWTNHKAMKSFSEITVTPTATPQPLAGSTGNSVCYIAGFEGNLVSSNGRNPATVTLWWPGETSPNNYQNDTPHDGTHWFAQLVNSSTEKFTAVHVNCIDIGLVDPGDPRNSVNAYNALQISGLVSIFQESPSPGMKVTSPVFGSACFFTQMAAQGSWNGGACGGNVGTSEVDNGPQFIPYKAAYQYNGGLYYGPSSVNGKYVIGESLPGTGGTCNTAVSSLTQDCIRVIQ